MVGRHDACVMEAWGKSMCRFFGSKTETNCSICDIQGTKAV